MYLQVVVFADIKYEHLYITILLWYFLLHMYQKIHLNMLVLYLWTSQRKKQAGNFYWTLSEAFWSRLLGSMTLLARWEGKGYVTSMNQDKESCVVYYWCSGTYIFHLWLSIVSKKSKSSLYTWNNFFMTWPELLSTKLKMK